MFKEFDVLYTEYVNTNLLTYRTKKHMIDFELFIRKLPYSCLIESMIDRLSCFFDRPSIFSHDPNDIHNSKVLFNIDREDNHSKIGAINSQGFNNAVVDCLKRL